MGAHLILAFCAPGDQERVLSAARALGAVLYFKEPPDAPLEPPPERILLGIGPAGCAALAAHVQERGLEGVAAVVLVDPAAPWAERTKKQSCPACGFPGCDGPGCTCPCHPRLPLTALEPLRAVAEMAIYGERCKAPRCTGDFEGTNDRTCEVCGDLPVNQLRLVLAVCPEAPRCTADGCDELGLVPADTIDGEPMWKPCTACSGTGRMLSSAEVARELTGIATEYGALRAGDAPEISSEGAATVIRYPERSALLAHGLEAALREALDDAR